MSFFNLRRMAKLLSIVMALMPVMDVAAAVTPISQAAAGSMVQDAASQGDISALIAAAGITGTLAGTLQYAFNAGVVTYRSSRNINIASIFSNYVNLTSAANASGATVAAVNAAMQSLMTLIAALFVGYKDSYIDTAVQNLSLPLTSASLSQSAMPAGQSADQYLVNILLNELAAWLPIQQAAASGQNNNNNNAMLLAAAKQLGLIPTTAAAMQNLINVAGCSNQPTIQKEINCAISWYNNWIQTVNSNIGLVAQATQNLDDLVTAANSTINGYVATYGAQINNATSLSDIANVYNAGVAAINGVYPALIGESGTIEAQNSIASNLEAALATSMNQLGSVMSTQIQTLQSSLNTAAQAFTAASKAADISFPESLPVSGLTATTAVNFASSVPGNAVNQLNNAQGDITNPTSSVTANTAALTKAINDFANKITLDQNAAVKIISAATTTAATSAALTSSIATLNTDYTNLMSASGEYVTALNNAQQTEANLTALSKTHAQITGIATALTTIQAAINSANAQLPTLPQGGFTVANTALASGTIPAGEYASSLAGAAIQAMVSAQNTANNKISGGGNNSGGLSSSEWGAIIGAIVGVLGLSGLAAWLLTKNGQAAIQDEVNDIMSSEDPDPTTQQLTSQELDDLKGAADQAISSGNDLDLESFVEQFRNEAFTSARGTNMYRKFVGVNSVDNPDQVSALKELVAANTPEGDTTFEGFKTAITTTDAQLNALSGQEFSRSDVLTMASDPAYLPDGFSGSLGDAVKLINKAISSDSTITKSGLTSDGTGNIADAELQQAIKDYTTSVSSTGKLPQAPQDINIGGAGSGQNVPGADAFNELANSETGVTKEALQNYIKENSMTKSDFLKQIANLSSELDDLRENADANAEQIKELESQYDAAREALIDPDTPFDGE